MGRKQCQFWVFSSDNDRDLNTRGRGIVHAIKVLESLLIGQPPTVEEHPVLAHLSNVSPRNLVVPLKRLFSCEPVILHHVRGGNLTCPVGTRLTMEED